MKDDLDREKPEKTEKAGSSQESGPSGPYRLLLHSDVTWKIIGAFRDVYNNLGVGFSEKVYHGALLVELTRRGLDWQSEVPIRVNYRGVYVGEFFADIIVNECVIIEIKVGKEIHPEHRAQLFNYLKATKYEVGLLINFGTDPKYERKQYDNKSKGSLTWVSA